MHRGHVLSGLLVIAFMTSCGERTQIEIPDLDAGPSPSSSPTLITNLPPTKPDLKLQKQLGEIAAEAKGKVGVFAVLIETGDVVVLNSDEHFPMQSVYKLPISMAVMQQVTEGKISLEEKVGVAKSDFVGAGQHSPIRDKYPNGAELSVKDLIQFAVSESDGTASDVLMRVAGGPAAIQDYLTSIGIEDIKILNTEKEIGQNWETQYKNWATPKAAVDLLLKMRDWSHWKDSSEEAAQLLTKFMADSSPGAKRLKGLLPAGTVVAHKTGTSGTQNGITAATNDIGVVALPNGKHIAIAVFVSDSPADEKTREAVIAKIARAVWDKWSR